jgi:SAM-dependent methyltransferase
MDSQPRPSARVDELVAQLKAKVEQRRRDGVYPPGLEDDLDAHFHRIARHRVEPDTEALEARLAALEERIAFSAERIGLDSGVPGGSALHRTVAKVVGRQTQGVLQQVQEFADAVRDALRAMADSLDDATTHVHADLVGQLDAVFERLAAFERGPVGSAAAVADLRRRVEELEAAERVRRFRPTYSRARLADESLGDREDVKQERMATAELLRGAEPVLDLGCGRGELVEALTELGVGATGVEPDAELAAVAEAHGVSVLVEDPLAVLAAADDASLGAVAALGLVERLTAQELVELVALAAEKVRAGGRVVVEAGNPESLLTLTRRLPLAPPGAHAVHPAYLTFLFREAGFGDVQVHWRSPASDEELLDELPELPEGEVAKVVNENARRVNQLLFAPRGYVLVAVR